MVALAILTGIGAGLAALFFRFLIDNVVTFGYGFIPSLLDGNARYYVILVPTAGGLIVGPLIYFFAREC